MCSYKYLKVIKVMSGRGRKYKMSTLHKDNKEAQKLLDSTFLVLWNLI